MPQRTTHLFPILCLTVPRILESRYFSPKILYEQRLMSLHCGASQCQASLETREPGRILLSIFSNCNIKNILSAIISISRKVVVYNIQIYVHNIDIQI